MKNVAGLIVIAWLLLAVYSFWPLASGEVTRAIAKICLMNERQDAQGLEERLKEFGLPPQPAFDCSVFERDTYYKAFIYAVLVLAGFLAAIFAIFNARRQTVWLLLSAVIYLVMWGWKVAGKDIVQLYRIMFTVADSPGRLVTLLGLEVLIPLIFVMVAITSVIVLIRERGAA